MTFRILVIAEGEHELGNRSDNGALIVLLRRIFNEPMSIEWTCHRIRELAQHMHPGKGNRLSRKLIGLIKYAQSNCFDAIITLIDQDGDDSRHSSALIAQDSTLTSLPRAMGIAVKTFDAWFLADHHALSKVLRIPIDQQPDPERISSPKSHCESLQAQSQHSPALREVYRATAEICDLNLLKQRCPMGFGTFTDRVIQVRGVLERRGPAE